MRTFLLSASLLGLVGCNFFSSPTLDFEKLHGTLTEAEAMKLQPGLNWQCSDNDAASAPHFGQRVCDGLGEKINGIPALRLDYFFRDGTLGFALAEFKPDAYPAIEKMMDAKYKRRASVSAPPGFGSGKATAWDAGEGVAMSSGTEKNDRGNVFVLWVSNKEADRRR